MRKRKSIGYWKNRRDYSSLTSRRFKEEVNKRRVERLNNNSNDND